MNHRGTEKKKKHSVQRRRYIQLFAKAVFGIGIVWLFVIGAVYIYNLAQYQYHRNLWDAANYGGVVFPYVVSDGEAISLAPLWTNSDDLWAMAWECVQRVFCTIRYDDKYHYPEYIYPKYNKSNQIDEAINADRLLFCADEQNYQICEVFLPRNQ